MSTVLTAEHFCFDDVAKKFAVQEFVAQLAVTWVLKMSL
jgi:hypothetical protein